MPPPSILGGFLNTKWQNVSLDRNKGQAHAHLGSWILHSDCVSIQCMQCKKIQQKRLVLNYQPPPLSSILGGFVYTKWQNVSVGHDKGMQWQHAWHWQVDFTQWLCFHTAWAWQKIQQKKFSQLPLLLSILGGFFNSKWHKLSLDHEEGV